MILRGQVALFASRCCMRGLDQGLAQPRTAMPGLATLALAPAFVVPGTHPRPTRQMAGAGKAAHINTDFRQYILGHSTVNAWDRIEPGNIVVKRAHSLHHLLTHPYDGLVQIIHMF